MPSPKTFRERDIEKAVCEYARDKGVFVHKMQTGLGGTAGMPDRIFHHNGRTWYIEFKAFGKKLSALQARKIADIEYHGITVYVVDNIQYGKDVVDGEAV